MKDILNSYYKKLLKESIYVSLLKSGTISLFVMFAVLIANYFLCFNIIVPILTLLFAFVGGFFAVFRKPSMKEVSKRIDELGLEERIITMEQFKNDNSFIAVKQREDALNELSKFNASLIKFIVPVYLIVMISISSILCVCGVTLNVLAENSVIKSGKEVVKELVEEEPTFYEVSYEFTNGGIVEGNIFQIVESGKITEEVIAIADDGYVFVGWSDGVEAITRTDTVISDIVVIAQFEELQYNEDEESEDGEADSDTNEPSEEQDESSENNGKEPSDKQGGGEGGQWSAHDSINNGAEDYGDFYNSAYGEATDGSSGLNENQQSAVGNYFGSISKGKN